MKTHCFKLFSLLLPIPITELETKYLHLCLLAILDQYQITYFNFLNI